MTPTTPAPPPNPGVRGLYEGNPAFNATILDGFSFAASEYAWFKAQLVRATRTPDTMVHLRGGNLYFFKHAVDEGTCALALLDELGDLAMLDHVVDLLKAAYTSLKTRWVRRPNGQWATSYQAVLEPSGNERFWHYYGSENDTTPSGSAHPVDDAFYGTNLNHTNNWHWYGFLANAAFALRQNTGKASPKGYDYGAEGIAARTLLDEFETLWMGTWGRVNEYGAVNMQSDLYRAAINRLRYHVFRNLYSPRASDQLMVNLIVSWLKQDEQVISKVGVTDGLIVFPNFSAGGATAANVNRTTPYPFNLTQQAHYVFGTSYHLYLAKIGHYDETHMRRLANTLEHCVHVAGHFADLAYDVGGGGPNSNGLAATDPGRQRVAYRDGTAMATGVRYTQSESDTAPARLAYEYGLRHNLWLGAKFGTFTVQQDVARFRFRLANHEDYLFDKASLTLSHLSRNAWKRDGDNTTAPAPQPQPTPTPTPTPEPTPSGTPLVASRNFSAATHFKTHQQRQLYAAFTNGIARSRSVYVPSITGSMYSDLRKTVIDMYGLRIPKRFGNTLRAVLYKAPDPALVKQVYDLIEPVSRTFEYNWQTWNSDKLPGQVDSSGTVEDKYSADHGKKRWNGGTRTYNKDGSVKNKGNGIDDNGGDRSLKGAYKRWGAWHETGFKDDGTWKNSPKSLNSTTKKQSPDYRNDRAQYELPQYKKLLYMHETAEGIAQYGTHLHVLENLLAHSYLFWCGYILDANRHLNTAYGTVADLLYDYAFNHWEHVIEKMSPRNQTTGVYPIEKSLYHNAAAHASIYDCFVQWRRLPNDPATGRKGRDGRARDIDVKALKSMVGYIIEDLVLYDVPKDYSQVANPTRYKFANWSHHNTPYARANRTAKNPIPDGSGPADTTYATEWGSEIINLMLGGATNHSGVGFSKTLMGHVSNTYGMTVEVRQVRGRDFDTSVSEHLGACRRDDDKYPTPLRRVRFNDGVFVSASYGADEGQAYAMAVGTGGAKSNGFPSHGGIGSYFHWADPTPEKYNLRQWARRGKNNARTNYIVDAATLIGDPGHDSNKSWDWVAGLLITAILDPDTDLTRLDLSW